MNAEIGRESNAEEREKAKRGRLDEKFVTTSEMMRERRLMERIDAF